MSNVMPCHRELLTCCSYHYSSFDIYIYSTVSFIFFHFSLSFLLTFILSFSIDQASQFHFRNGAELYKINWQANVESEGSMKSSLGIMVNYVYQLDRLEQNARNYALDSKQYVLSDEVRQCMLLR